MYPELQMCHQSTSWSQVCVLIMHIQSSTPMLEKNVIFIKAFDATSSFCVAGLYGYSSNSACNYCTLYNWYQFLLSFFLSHVQSVFHGPIHKKQEKDIGGKKASDRSWRLLYAAIQKHKMVFYGSVQDALAVSIVYVHIQCS